VRWYGIMVALAVVTVVTWGLLLARKDPKISLNTIVNIAIVGIISGIIGARLFHVVVNLQTYIKDPLSIFGGEGLAIYGAVLGAALGAWIYSKFSKFNYGYYADAIAPGIILAQAVGRVGCTLNGCCYGTSCDLPWAITYTDPSHGALIQSVHPTQIYEIFYNLLIFGVLLLFRKRFRPDGSLFMIYLMLYSAWRLGIGFIRQGPDALFGMHEAQLLAIVVLLITIPLLIWRTRWIKKDEDIIET
jgi:phosphatidylglycerol:prolipoprotein diacylglycerol transferase